MRKVVLAMLLVMGMSIGTVSLGQEKALNNNDLLRLVSQEQEKQSYSDAELLAKGLEEKEIIRYKSLLQGEEGQWWGHLEPELFMAFAAKDDSQRSDYVSRYLLKNYPRANAERKTLIAFRKETKKLAPKLIEQALSKVRKIIKNQLFINLSCESCGEEVKSLIEQGAEKIDIYFQGAKTDAQIISWAEKYKLPPEKITLNHDNGLYEKYFSVPLTTFAVFTL